MLSIHSIYTFHFIDHKAIKNMYIYTKRISRRKIGGVSLEEKIKYGRNCQRTGYN